VADIGSKPEMKAFLDLPDDKVWELVNRSGISPAQRDALLQVWALDRATAAVDESSPALRATHAFINAAVNKGTFLGISSLANRTVAGAAVAVSAVASHWTIPYEMAFALQKAQDAVLAEYNPALGAAGMATGFIGSLGFTAVLSKGAKAATEITAGEAGAAGPLTAAMAKLAQTALVGPAVLLPSSLPLAASIPVGGTVNGATAAGITYEGTDGDLTATRIAAVNGFALGAGMPAVQAVTASRVGQICLATGTLLATDTPNPGYLPASSEGRHITTLADKR
jgi:hypothetical protein